VPSGKELVREEYYAVMAGSTATLNIHGNHTGFNMRAFEAPGVGALQLIDRADIDEFYDVGSEVLVVNSPAEIVENFNRARQDHVWASRIREAGRKRTLAEHTLVHRMRVLETTWL
jgi:spore maturation protein CgeB